MKLSTVPRMLCAAILLLSQTDTFFASGSTHSRSHDSAERDSEQNQNQQQRKLQLPPIVSQEIGIVATMIPQLDAELVKYETTLTLRFTNYFGAMWWNCVAAYSNTYKDTLTGVAPTVSVTDSALHTTAARALCGAQAAVSYSALSLPGAVPGVVSALAGIGITVANSLDPAVAACTTSACLQSHAATKGFDGITMGHIVAKQVYDFSINDGWNQLGKDNGCVVNCRAYRDVTGYVPQNSPYTSTTTGNQNGNGNSNGNQNGNGNGNQNGNSISDRWQPLLEDNGKGYFSYQEHVTPQLGKRALFRFLPASDRTNRVIYPPGYSKSRALEANTVIARMATLNDIKKIQIEQFDNKLLVAGALINSFVGKVLTDQYVDTQLGKPGLVLTYERFVHFVQALLAADLDAGIIAWKEKVNYDLIRPTSVVKNWGSTPITTWARGVGVTTYAARDFEAYIRVMPHSEYVSGTSCLFQAQEELVNGYLAEIGLDPSSYPIAFPTVAAGASKVEPGITPAAPVTLTFPDMATMNTVGSNSRLDGGMHFEESIPAGQDLCSGIADYALIGSFNLY